MSELDPMGMLLDAARFIEGDKPAWAKAARDAPTAPDGWVLVPRTLTAENGAKAALIGDFSETFDYIDDEGDGCTAAIPVSWDTIKSIHTAMVAHFDDAAVAPSTARNAVSPACGEPIAYRYLLATAKSTDGVYGGWEPRLDWVKPITSEGSLRDLTPLYAVPPVLPTDARTAEPATDAAREKLANFLAIASKVRVSYHDGVRAAERDLTDIEISLIFAALSSAPAAAVSSEWRDISTAPKDGTCVLITDFDGVEVVAFFQGGSWLVRWDHEIFTSPTHWHPLPALSPPRKECGGSAS